LASGWRCVGGALAVGLAVCVGVGLAVRWRFVLASRWRRTNCHLWRPEDVHRSSSGRANKPALTAANCHSFLRFATHFFVLRLISSFCDSFLTRVRLCHPRPLHCAIPVHYTVQSPPVLLCNPRPLHITPVHYTLHPSIALCNPRPFYCAVPVHYTVQSPSLLRSTPSMDRATRRGKLSLIYFLSLISH